MRDGGMWWAALASVGLLAGCASLESISSGHVGCPAEEVQISEHDKGMRTSTWVATCRGKRHFCTATKSGGGQNVAPTTQVRCTPEHIGKLTEGSAQGGGNGGANSSGGESAPADDVRRVTRQANGEQRTYIEARWRSGPFVLRLFRATGSDKGSNIVTRMTANAGQHEQCQLRIVIDGELVELERAAYRHNGGYEEVSSKIPQDVLRRLSNAERAAGRVCSDEWRLDDRGRRVLDEYLARLDEERASAGEGETEPAGPSADAGTEGDTGAEAGGEHSQTSGSPQSDGEGEDTGAEGAGDGTGEPGDVSDDSADDGEPGSG